MILNKNEKYSIQKCDRHIEFNSFSYFNDVTLKFDAPKALISLIDIETPCPVLLPGTINSPRSIGSSDGMSYSGIPSTSFGFSNVIDFTIQPLKSGSVWLQTCKYSAAKFCK